MAHPAALYYLTSKTWEMTMTVLNARDLPRTGWPEATLYIGRNTQLLARSGVSGPSVHGNPFRMATQDAVERKRVIDAHRGYLSGMLLDSAFQATVQGMRGKNLVCHCAPQACHGHTYDAAIQALDQGKPALVPTPAQHLQMAAAVANAGPAVKADPHPSAVAASAALRALAVQHVASGALAKSPEGRWVAHPDKITPTPELEQLGRQAHQAVTRYITQKGAETPAGMALTQGLVAVGRDQEPRQKAPPSRASREPEF